MNLKYCCVSILAVILVACGSSSDYRNAIPARSAAVVSLDLNSMSKKSGLSDDQTLQNRVKAIVKSGLSGADELIDKIFANVSETGLGLSDRVYLFAGEQAKTGGVLVKVEDEGKLEDLLEVLASQNICEKIRETDGCKWTVAGGILLAYKSHAMLVVSDSKGSSPSSLARQASMWLRQESGEGFAATADFQLLDKKQSDIAVWNTLEVFPTEMIYPIVMGVSAELSLKDVKAVSSIDFEKGKVMMDIETIFNNEIMKGIMENKQKVMSPIRGKYLDKFPSNTPFWATANIKGDEFFDFICGNPSVRRYFEKSMLPVDFASVFDAIEGDVALSMSGTNSRDFIAFAEVKDKSFLESFESLKGLAALSGGQVIFRNHGNNGYEFKTYDGSIVGLKSGPVALWIGVKDNVLYLTNKESLIDRRVLGLSLRNKEWGKRVEGQMFFMASDFSSFNKLVGMKESKGVMSVVWGLLGGLDYFTVESADGNNLHIEVCMKNKDINPLSVVLNQ